MIDSKLLNDLSTRLSRHLPADLGVLKEDIERNIRATLQNTFQKLDLVGREEFDVQCELLARTRARLESLEQRLEALEKPVAGKKKRSGSGEKPQDKP